MESLTDRARKFAEEYHKNQKYGDETYTTHLHHVVNVLDDAHIRSDEFVAAAWLHDVVEDTVASHAMIAGEFGLDVHRLVYSVTGHGDTRKERNQWIYESLEKYPAAKSLKVADRISNLEYGCKTKNKDKLRMYIEEDIDFFLYAISGANSMYLIYRYYMNIEKARLICD